MISSTTKKLLHRHIISKAQRTKRYLQSKPPKHQHHQEYHSQKRKEITQKWLDSIVIGEKLCPFAPPVSKEPKLRIHVSKASNHDEVVDEISKEAAFLLSSCVNSSVSDDHSGESNDYQIIQEHASISDTRPETTLVVLDEQKCPSLNDFRDLVYLSWRIQDEAILRNGFEKDLQIVLFHPLAVHDTYSTLPPPQSTSMSHVDSPLEDAANYTTRSPFPIVHLLREIDVYNVVKYGKYPDLEGLPSSNKAKLRKLGLDYCQQKLENCFYFC